MFKHWVIKVSSRAWGNQAVTPVTQTSKGYGTKHHSNKEDGSSCFVFPSSITHQFPLVRKKERKKEDNSVLWWQEWVLPKLCLCAYKFTSVCLKWKGIDLTCEVNVDLKAVLSYTHPFWHGTVGSSVVLEEFFSRWYWGSANISQELGVPSSWTGILTTSLSTRDKFLKTSPSSRWLMSQWWEGTAAMKLFRKKWQGIVKRLMKLMIMIIIWNLPNPLILARMFSNFIVVSWREWNILKVGKKNKKTIALSSLAHACTLKRNRQ